MGMYRTWDKWGGSSGHDQELKDGSLTVQALRDPSTGRIITAGNEKEKLLEDQDLLRRMEGIGQNPPGPRPGGNLDPPQIRMCTGVTTTSKMRRARGQYRMK